MSLGVFHVLGRPLQENAPPSPEFQKIVSQSDMIIGESRSHSDRVLARCILKTDVFIFFLDNQNPKEKIMMQETLKKISQKGGTCCLFSDMGMPLLFDPGQELLLQARNLRMQVRCLPAPTSWGTACALSGWNPPFELVGFLSQKAERRSEELTQLKGREAHLVLLDTPYRYRALLTDCCKIFGQEHQAFLAWEIGNKEERYLWGSLHEILRLSEKLGLKKGEFILLLEKPRLK